MGKVGVYGCCGKNWGYAQNGLTVRPVWVPISEDGGSVMAVCEICAPDLAVEKIAEFAMDAYIASSEAMPVEPQDARMGCAPTPQLAEPTATLKTWVRRQQELGAR